MVAVKNFEILDKNFNSVIAHSEFIKDDSLYSKLFVQGYSLECMWLPNPPARRLVGGLESVELVLSDSLCTIRGCGEYAYFIAIILGIDFCNHWEYIDRIVLNNRFVSSIKVKDITGCDDIEIGIYYTNRACAEYACSVLYYLISPYKNNDYYLEKELTRWCGGDA